MGLAEYLLVLGTKKRFSLLSSLSNKTCTLHNERKTVLVRVLFEYYSLRTISGGKMIDT